MALEKDHPLKLSKPDSTMRLVYESIRDGNHTAEKIRVDVCKYIGPVKAAIYNLSHVGMIKPVQVNGITHWYLRDDAPCDSPKSSEVFKRCPSIFMVSNHQ